MLLRITSWSGIEALIEALVPIGICVVLPILIISMIMRNRRHEVDKKTELMMKAIENGTTLDPSFFQQANCCREKTVKDKLMGWLLAACITSGIGLLSCASMLAAFIPRWRDLMRSPGPGPIFSVLSISGVLIAVGIAFFIVYFIGKNKTWKKELAELDAKKPEA